MSGWEIGIYILGVVLAGQTGGYIAGRIVKDQESTRYALTSVCLSVLLILSFVFGFVNYYTGV